jgi:glycerate dehydrogenase
MTARITCLDTSTLDRGDLDFSPLRELGSLMLHPMTRSGERIDRCRASDIVITNKVVLDEAVLRACPNLRYVVIAATGTNNVDLRAAAAGGIPVSNVTGYSSPSVAQHVLGLILTFATQLHRYLPEPSAWPDSPVFTRLDYPIVELEGKTLGIAGLGSIGSRVATLAQAFGMHVVALARKRSNAGLLEGNAPSSSGGGVGTPPRLNREELFATSDFISLHCPLTEETRHLVNSSTLALMKPGAFLINTGRGQLVDEQALLHALETGTLGGAALDVLSVEPPPPEHPLIRATSRFRNLLITPHCAWASHETRSRLLRTVANYIRAFLETGSVASRVA